MLHSDNRVRLQMVVFWVLTNRKHIKCTFQAPKARAEHSVALAKDAESYHVGAVVQNSYVYVVCRSKEDDAIRILDMCATALCKVALAQSTDRRYDFTTYVENLNS